MAANGCFLEFQIPRVLQSQRSNTHSTLRLAIVVLVSVLPQFQAIHKNPPVPKVGRHGNLAVAGTGQFCHIGMASTGEGPWNRVSKVGPSLCSAKCTVLIRHFRNIGLTWDQLGQHDPPTSAQPGPTWLQLRPNMTPTCRTCSPCVPLLGPTLCEVVADEPSWPVFARLGPPCESNGWNFGNHPDQSRPSFSPA